MLTSQNQINDVKNDRDAQMANAIRNLFNRQDEGFFNVQVLDNYDNKNYQVYYRNKKIDNNLYNKDLII
jgi:hypothetical protein